MRYAVGEKCPAALLSHAMPMREASHQITLVITHIYDIIDREPTTRSPGSRAGTRVRPCRARRQHQPEGSAARRPFRVSSDPPSCGPARARLPLSRACSSKHTHTRTPPDTGLDVVDTSRPPRRGWAGVASPIAHLRGQRASAASHHRRPQPVLPYTARYPPQSPPARQYRRARACAHARAARARVHDTTPHPQTRGCRCPAAANPHRASPHTHTPPLA